MFLVYVRIIGKQSKYFFQALKILNSPHIFYIKLTRKCDYVVEFLYTGFGGNVVREEVKSRSKWYVESFQELIDAL